MADESAQPYSELASFGEELKREREIRGISLKEIADATKISKRFLEAIEKNDHKTLPAPVFTRGFVREYARYLGLSAEEIVSRYNHAAAGDDRIEKTPHLERLVQLHAPEAERARAVARGIPPPYARIDRNVYILGAIIVALLAMAYWAVQRKQDGHSDVEATRADTAPVAPAPPRPATSSSTTTIQIAAPKEDVLRMTIEMVDDSWVTLDADGKTVISEQLRKGEQRTVEAKERFRFRTVGNAAGVRLTLNEFKVPPLGRDGQVIHDRTFDRQWLDARSPETPRAGT